jgi:hypothetical protein
LTAYVVKRAFFIAGRIDELPNEIQVYIIASMISEGKAG